MHSTGTNPVSIAIASLALLVSAGAFLASWWRDRRDVLLHIYEYLMSVDQQRGRRLVHEHANTRVEDLSKADYDSVNNALSSLEVLAFYYQRRYCKRKDVRELWARTVVLLMADAQPFLVHRDGTRGATIWPHLRAFEADARQYLQRHPGRSVTANLSDPDIPDQGAEGAGNPTD